MNPIATNSRSTIRLASVCVILAALTAPVARPAVAAPATARGALATLAPAGARMKRLSGEIETQTYDGRQWITVHERFWFEAPDRFRVVTTPPPNSLGEPSISTWYGKRSYLFMPRSRRLVRWNRNLFLQWTRMYGGPANIAGFLTGLPAVPARYRTLLRADEKVGDRNCRVVSLREKRPQYTMVRDYLSINSERRQTICAPFLRPLYEEPPHIRLFIDMERGVVLRRDHLDHANRLEMSATASAAEQLQPGLWFPTRWEIRNAAGQLVRRVEYANLKAGDDAETTAFGREDVAGILIEDGDLKSVPEYRALVTRAPRDLSARLNLARALWLYQANRPDAMSELKRVAAGQPGSIAAWRMLFDLQSQAGHLQPAWDSLQQLGKAAPAYPSLHMLMAGVRIAMHRLDDAMQVLQSVDADSPEALPAWVLLADLKRRRDQEKEAAQLYLKALQLPAVDSEGAREAAAVGLRALCQWGKSPTLPDIGEEAPAVAQAQVHRVRGDVALWRGDVKTAQAEHKRALSLDPDNLELATAIAHWWHWLGYDDEAARQYRDIDTRWPRSVDAELSAIDFAAGRIQEPLSRLQQNLAAVNSERQRRRLRRGFRDVCQKALRHDELMAELRRRHDAKTATIDEELLLSELLVWEDEPEQALATCRQALLRFPHDGVLLSTTAALLVDDIDRKAKAEGRLRSRDRDYTPALRLIQQAIDRDPDQLFFPAQSAYVLDRGLRVVEANRVGENLSKAHPNDPYVSIIRGCIRNKDNPLDAYPLIQRLNAALDALKSPLGETFDEAAFIRQALVRAYESKSLYARAEEQLRILKDTATNDHARVGFRVALLRLAMRRKHYADIIDLVCELLRGPYAKPERQETLDLVVRTMADDDEFRKGMEAELQARLQKQPNDACLAELAGAISFSRQALDLAVRNYEVAVVAAPDRVETRSRLADILMANKDFDQAARAYEAALRDRPLAPDDYLQLARCHLASGKADKALDVGRRMMLHMPMSRKAFQNLGQLQAEADRWDEAAISFGRAEGLARLDPAEDMEIVIRCRLARARCLVQAGQPDQAQPLFESLTVKQCSPHYRVPALFALADIHAAAGRKEEAKAALRHILDISENENTHKRAEDKLAALD